MIAPPGCGFWAAALAAGAWEETLRETALALTPGRAVAVDAGAHVGAWTLPLAEEFGRVIAFEPCAANRACLLANAAGLRHVEIEDTALGDAFGEARLGLPAERDVNSGQHMIGAAGAAVRVVPLDAWALPELDLLKIDVEGFELPVLRGALDTLRRCRPVVVMEENGTAALHGLPPRGARGFLLGLGYRVAARDADNLIMTPG